MTIAVNKNAHSWSAYKITKAATVFKTGIKTHTCNRCKKKETATVPKLKAKITGVSSKLTVEKGKTASLKPVRNPISSQEKITYQSSDKKIATVDSAGKIKGIRPGKAVITVKAGTVKVKCTVTVTK